MTIVLGIAGSVLVGFLLHSILGEETRGGFIGTIIGATIGALVLIWLFRRFSREA